MDNNKQHKHAELIKAFLNGVKIQVLSPFSGRWYNEPNPSWHEELSYRTEPENKNE